MKNLRFGNYEYKNSMNNTVVIEPPTNEEIEEITGLNDDDYSYLTWVGDQTKCLLRDSGYFDGEFLSDQNQIEEEWTKIDFDLWVYKIARNRDQNLRALAEDSMNTTFPITYDEGVAIFEIIHDLFNFEDISGSKKVALLDSIDGWIHCSTFNPEFKNLHPVSELRYLSHKVANASEEDVVQVLNKFAALEIMGDDDEKGMED
ncbi:hypothetical protein P3T73_03300 [Kiritimatiellota bacterium B12222]|nr:hypothetical protein P3T73_03300 [Kiritimatiellota bacterium B12222]